MAKFNISQLRKDKKKVAEGVWVDVEEGLRILVASTANTKYRDEIRKLLDPAKAKLTRGVGEISAKEAEDASKLAAAKYILLGWENLQEEKDGELVDVPYSWEKALDLFEEFPDFFDLVMTNARKSDLFRAESLKEAAGN